MIHNASKNWKLAVLALFFICLFTSLGFWQLSRAGQKRILLQSFAARGQQTPLTAAALNQTADWRFYRASLQGSYDNQHTLLLDNKIFNGQIGYEVYTPFKARGLAQPVLIDRGFIPLGKSRKELPVVQNFDGEIQVSGLLNLPPRYVAFGPINDGSISHWPMRVEFINLPELSKILGYSLAPYVINITPKEPSAYAVEWQIVTMGPEKHMGYAIQWFAFALTLLILFVALNRNTNKDSG